jgi:hypothetical protein
VIAPEPTCPPPTPRTTLPSYPGPDQQEWRCKHCKNLIGIVSSGYVFTQRVRREVVACLPVAIKCEDCGRRNERET